MSKPTNEDLDQFYRRHWREISRHCRRQQIPIEKIQMHVDSLCPNQVEYRLGKKVILKASCKLVLQVHIERHDIEPPDPESAQGKFNDALQSDRDAMQL